MPIIFQCSQMAILPVRNCFSGKDSMISRKCIVYLMIMEISLIKKSNYSL